MDGSGGATWPEKTISPKVSTVGPDPHGKVSDPYIYRPDPQVRSRTSEREIGLHLFLNDFGG
jgi:hypothetical protein